MFDLKKYAQNVAVITEDGIWYLYSDVEKFCNIFLQCIGKRSLILILCTNTAESFFGYIASVQGDHVPLLLGKDMHLSDVERFIASYIPEYLWIPEHFQVENYGKITKCLIVFQWGNYKLVQIIGEKKKMHGELALLLTTSGVTGNLKMVRLSRKNLQANTESICKFLQISKTHRAVTTLPMNYTYGLSVLNTHLYMGASVFLTEYSVLDKRFWHKMIQNGITSFSGVPYTYEMLRRIDIRKWELPDLKIFTQAGGRLQEQERNYFRKYSEDNDCIFYVMYGQTEATARISYVSPEKGLLMDGCIGKPITGGNMYIENEKKERVLTAFTCGQIIYEGANVMMGYADGRNKLLDGDVQGNRLNTGDIGYFDEDGDFFIVGRCRRFTKICGKRINLDDVERILCDRLSGNVMCVEGKNEIFVLADRKYMNAKSICIKLCDYYKIGRKGLSMLYVKQLPYTDSGKKDYMKAKELLGRYSLERKGNA